MIRQSVSAFLSRKSAQGRSGSLTGLLVASIELFVAAQTTAWASPAVTTTQFAVTEGGAANITIPLKVPRGIGGIEPQLALAYSSSSGNGLIGLGWTLQGPSAITRCPQSKAIDGVRGVVAFNGSDRFCLDGQRLVLVNSADPNQGTPPSASTYGAENSEYRTQSDGFSRITAIGQYQSQTNVPRGFRVETKSGLILEFGNATDAADDSSIVPTNRSSALPPASATVNRWMLRRISDRLGSPGNFAQFHYCRGEVTPGAAAPVASGSVISSCTALSPWQGSAPLHYIEYTNRSSAVNKRFGVVFRYESRPDTPRVYHAGSSSRQTQRMSSVQTFVAFGGPSSPGTLVRSYDIYYEPIAEGSVSKRATQGSRLSRIKERGFDGSTPLELPAVLFTYADDAVFGQYVLHQEGGTTGAPPAQQCGGLILGRPQQSCR